MSDHNVALCISLSQLQPLVPESSLSYSHLSHSVSSHLDSSPESSEAGADIPLSRTGKMFKWVYVLWGLVEGRLGRKNRWCELIQQILILVAFVHLW